MEKVKSHIQKILQRSNFRVSGSTERRMVGASSPGKMLNTRDIMSTIKKKDSVHMSTHKVIYFKDTG